MPIYSYVCKKCGKTFDLLEGMTAHKAEKKCPQCGSKNIERTLAAFSVGAGGGGSDFPMGGSCPTGTCGL